MFYLFLHSSVSFFFLLGEQAIRHFLPSCTRKAHHQDRVSVFIDVLACFSDKRKRSITGGYIFGHSNSRL